jgi:hypothetical protein
MARSTSPVFSADEGEEEERGGGEEEEGKHRVCEYT